jgi:hypothetical protein
VVAVEPPPQQDRGSSLRHICHDPSVPRRYGLLCKPIEVCRPSWGLSSPMITTSV